MRSALKPKAHVSLLVSAILCIPLFLSAYSYVRIVRLSWVEGEVSVARPGDQEWLRGQTNLPLEHGTVVETPNGTAELEFESEAYARLASGSRLYLSELALLDTGGRLTQLSLEQGRATFSVKPRREDRFEVLTPYLKVLVPRESHFRVDLTPDGAQVRVFDGQVTVETLNESISVSRGTMLEWDTSLDRYQLVSLPALDDWDRWNLARNRQTSLGRHQALPANLSYGASDLHQYGRWFWHAPYGYVWQPWVSAGWAPFTCGRWIWYSSFGWTWVSCHQWGWLPFHYGSWHHNVFLGWVWVPGQFRRWSPARCRWVRGRGWIGWFPIRARHRHHRHHRDDWDRNRPPRGTVIVSEDGFRRGEQGNLAERIWEARGRRWGFSAAPTDLAPESEREFAGDATPARPNWAPAGPREDRVNRRHAGPAAPGPATGSNGFQPQGDERVNRRYAGPALPTRSVPQRSSGEGRTPARPVTSSNGFQPQGEPSVNRRYANPATPTRTPPSWNRNDGRVPSRFGSGSSRSEPPAAPRVERRYAPPSRSPRPATTPRAAPTAAPARPPAPSAPSRSWLPSRREPARGSVSRPPRAPQVAPRRQPPRAQTPRASAKPAARKATAPRRAPAPRPAKGKKD